ncbi:TPA: hypothetical protein OXK66_003788 [Acinetobacter baumannii]|nr:hypothetical protein DWA21_00795 [Acinetobacter baumannii]HCW3779116.1 hypothetical protein [Acinetobacter baumannii]
MPFIEFVAVTIKAIIKLDIPIKNKKAFAFTESLITLIKVGRKKINDRAATGPKKPPRNGGIKLSFKKEW